MREKFRFCEIVSVVTFAILICSSSLKAQTREVSLTSTHADSTIDGQVLQADDYSASVKKAAVKRAKKDKGNDDEGDINSLKGRRLVYEKSLKNLREMEILDANEEGALDSDSADASERYGVNPSGEGSSDAATGNTANTDPGALLPPFVGANTGDSGLGDLNMGVTPGDAAGAAAGSAAGTAPGDPALPESPPGQRSNKLQPPPL